MKSCIFHPSKKRRYQGKTLSMVSKTKTHVPLLFFFFSHKRVSLKTTDIKLCFVFWREKDAINYWRTFWSKAGMCSAKRTCELSTIAFIRYHRWMDDMCQRLRKAGVKKKKKNEGVGERLGWIFYRIILLMNWFIIAAFDPLHDTELWGLDCWTFKMCR